MAVNDCHDLFLLCHRDLQAAIGENNSGIGVTRENYVRLRNARFWVAKIIVGITESQLAREWPLCVTLC